MSILTYASMALCLSIRLRMNVRHVGFELTKQLLFRTQQPTSPPGFSGGGLVVRSFLVWPNNQAFTTSPDGESSPIDNTDCKRSSRFT